MAASVSFIPFIRAVPVRTEAVGRNDGPVSSKGEREENDSFRFTHSHLSVSPNFSALLFLGKSYNLDD